MIKTNTTFSRTSLLTAVVVIATTGLSQEQKGDEKKSDKYSERMLIVGKAKGLNTEAGSATVIDEQQLEKFEYDDIHQILAQVPGVNIREEDGFGLRPNIGFRGVTPERSKKINILEDGILIGPAPYSAPAAYYFPMVSRLSNVEVFKGPAAILYGPNTVAGTLNLQTRQVSAYDEGMVDVAVGADGYQKGHAYINESSGNFGVLLEGLTVNSDGFKQLDGGGDYSKGTGFSKNDFIGKLRYNLDSHDYNQVIEIKLGYSDELSDETYLGLTDQDFAANPYRRYAASQLGQMDWTHNQFQVNHFLSGDSFDVITRVYRNNFERAWRKLNNFNNQKNPATRRSLQQILQSPTDSFNAIYYEVLSGQRDSEESYEQLLIGTNDREFYSQGIQSDASWQSDLWGWEHHFKVGVRFHEDEIQRFHTEQSFNMVSGNLVSTGNPVQLTTANTERAEAWSLYLQDTLAWDQWELTLGVRGELIDSYYQNNLEGKELDWLKKTTEVWLPGVSTFYSIDNNSGVFAGVHRGFIPTSPQQSPEIAIEESVNTELGYRFANNGTRFEIVGFLSDFENLKESCTASTASNCINILDQEFNSGNAKVSGVELSYSDRLSISSDFDMPFSVIYTYNNAEFEEAFNSDYAMWGEVDAGDPIPYMPENQLTLTAGMEANQWRINLLARYTSELYEAAGDGVTLSGVSTEPMWITDISAAYDFINSGSLYFKLDNVFDEKTIVSRRPYGARPNKPQQWFMGYKYRW